MILHQLEIKNYRSLEHVELDHLGRFNVIIGRNNSGKSSVFGALSLLYSFLQGGRPDLNLILTGQDVSRSFEIRLLFRLSPSERVELIGLTQRRSQDKDLMIQSPLFRQAEYSFSTEAGAGNPALRELRVTAQNNKWAVIYRTDEGARGARPAGRVKLISALSERFATPLTNNVLDTTHPESTFSEAYPLTAFTGDHLNDPATSWIFQRLGSYLQKSFFFNPFRHSAASLPVSSTEKLAQDGSNLAQVLHTINSNDRDLFNRIEQFIQAALPDIGRLQTPLKSSTTEISFRSPAGNYPVRLHDMGGGIEQLLMVATVLLTTDDEHTLFLEEPESHLHAGAQRFLIEKLYEGDRQVFATTHSPILINSPRPMSIHQVRYVNNLTAVTRVDSSELLGAALEDIGSRNSDVLLSDSVLFVEGPGDQRVFEEWGDKTGQRLEEHNVTVIPMGGSDEAARGTRARSDVLEGISQRSPVPHIFILDRDERSKAEVSKLRDQLVGKVHLLERRELENYMLAPRALMEAILDKHRDDAVIRERVDSAKEDEVMSILRGRADSLFELVLVKRIRAEIGGLRGGLLPRETVAGLAQKVHHKSFARQVRREIEARVSSHLDALAVERIVAAEKAALQREWRKKENRLALAPGEELLSAVFHHFGSEYRKPNDTIRIAKAMTLEEIPEEVKNLIGRIVAMSNAAEN